MNIKEQKWLEKFESFQFETSKVIEKKGLRIKELEDEKKMIKERLLPDIEAIKEAMENWKDKNNTQKINILAKIVFASSFKDLE